jgi:hypothetical protein
MGTGVLNVLVGLLIMRIGKAALDKVLPPIITGSVAIVIGIALAGAALGYGFSQLGGCFHHLDRNHRFLRIPAGEGPDRHASHLIRRYRRLCRSRHSGCG